MSNELTKQTHELAVALNQSVLSVIGEEKLTGFEKAFQMANAIQFLQESLTPEVMKPIMALQGSKLGFKTDKDMDPQTKQKGKGYPLEVVKTCLIDAVLMGLQPYSNQFNIIGGNTYVTKEGLGELLKNAKKKGLKYSIIHDVPKIDPSKTFATVESTIRWEFNGEKNEEKVINNIKGNVYSSSDAYIGKAERKARYFLVNQLYDIEITDGEVTEEAEYTVVNTNATVMQQPATLSVEQINFKEFLTSELPEHFHQEIEEADEETISALMELNENLDSLSTVKELQSLAKAAKYSPLEQEMIKKRNTELKGG